MTLSEVRLSGFGGQGIITAGHIIGEAATLHDHKHAFMTEDYSPYITGGWSRADLLISEEEIDYPLVTHPDILLAMSQEALDVNWAKVKTHGVIVTESSFVNSAQVTDRSVFPVPATGIAEKLGKKVVANIVMLGALRELTKLVTRDAMEKAILNRFPKAAEINGEAFRQGMLHARDLAK